MNRTRVIDTGFERNKKEEMIKKKKKRLVQEDDRYKGVKS